MKAKLALGVLAVAAGGLAAYLAWMQLASPPAADPEDPRLVAAGRAVYIEHCAACHGENLEGEPDWRRRKPDGTLPAPPHDATGHTWHHPDSQLFELTKLGPAALAGGGYQSAMPGFAGTLEDHEIWAVLAYIKSRWPPEVREAQARRTRAARQ